MDTSPFCHNGDGVLSRGEGRGGQGTVSTTNSSGVTTNGSVQKDGSDMLAAALEQMDNIIACTKREYRNCNITPRPAVKGRLQSARAIFLMEDLKGTLEKCNNRQEVLQHASKGVLEYLREWLNPEQAQQCSSSSGETLEEKILRLESDKHGLQLQISVLREQLDAQDEKIRELEYCLDDKRSRLINAEQMLQNELLARASLETDKRDLMAEVTSLKIKLTSAERDRHELEDQLKTAQKRITELETKLLLKDAEVLELKQRITKNGTILPTEGSTAGDNGTNNRPLERERTLDRLKKKQGEIEKLKKAVDSLMLANEEKDRRLDEYRRLLRRYKKIEDMVVQAQGRRALEDFIATLDDDASSTTSSTSPSTGSGGKDTIDGLKIDEFRDKHQIGPSATSTPTTGNGTQKNHKISSPEKPLASPISPAPPDSYCPRTGGTGTLVRSNSCEEMSHSADKTPPATKKNEIPYSGYAQSEVVTDDEGCGHYGNSRNRLHHTDSGRWKGFKKFLGRLKRSSSQDFDGDRHEEFRRGGIRATAGARLAWSKDLKVTQDTDVPFVHWDSDRVIAWLTEIGLDMYVTEARKWVKTGDQLLKATNHDLEKELNMKNYLHRKKLQLALEAVNAGPKERIYVLSFNWVTRWLDDIGIPQYKDTFFDARIDGLMLHYMTVDDLLSLKVTNELHHISIKRAIQSLRLHNFDPQCLKRRPSADEGNLQNISNEVMLWSNHRVMEWLRTIDLSEYAPNLRGSGVHGALMVLEPRFNAELFSQVLSIPANKSLLRRHLSTHFVSLIGNDTQHKKRESETAPDYQPLFPNSKVKRRNNFLLFGHKRSKSESHTDSYICPIETPLSQNGKDTLVNGGMTTANTNHPQNSNGCIKERDEIAAKEIGAVSKEINSLTVMLSQEKFFDNVPTSNV